MRRNKKDKMTKKRTDRRTGQIIGIDDRPVAKPYHVRIDAANNLPEIVDTFCGTSLCALTAQMSRRGFGGVLVSRYVDDD